MIGWADSNDPVRLEGNDVREAAEKNDLRSLQSRETLKSATWAVKLNTDVLFGSERANGPGCSPEKIHYLLQRVAFVSTKGGQNYRRNHLLESYRHPPTEHAVRATAGFMEAIHRSRNVIKSEQDCADNLCNIYFIRGVFAVNLVCTSKCSFKCFIGAIQHGAMNF